MKGHKFLNIEGNIFTKGINITFDINRLSGELFRKPQDL